MKREKPIVPTCGECVFSKLDTASQINRDLNGRPFMLVCPFSQWKRFAHDTACDRFMPKGTDK